MRRLIVLLLALVVCVMAPAQRSKTTQRKKTTTQVQNKKNTKKTTTKKPAAKKPLTEREKMQASQKQLRQDIEKKKKQKAELDRRVKQQMQDVLVLGGEIDDKKRLIDTIRTHIATLDSALTTLNAEMKVLEKELADRQQRYVKSMRYMHRNRSAQSQMMFIFSADNFAQMFRRLRFMREYAAYQHVQGDEVKAQQEEVNNKFLEISVAKDHKAQLLAKGERERQALEGKQTEQQNVVKSLQKEQKTIQSIIAQQKKKDAALNAQIDRLIAEEVARQKARAEAEARRRAEAAARERELAEAKAREEKARAEAMAAKDKKSREEAERRVREAEEKRVAAQRKAESMPMTPPSEDVRISGNFESNRGRLPMPITGPYRVVSHFGQYNVEGLHNVTLDNKGINIKGENGAQARSIFDGEVSGVFSFGGTMVVMVRHGSYISVYCNLASVNVHRGQRVSTRQSLGRVGTDNILQFQLRKETAKLNPESWLGR